MSPPRSPEAKDEGTRMAATLRPHLIKQKDYTAFEELFRHHIESFDYMVDDGLEKMVKSIKPIEVLDPNSSKQKLRIWFGNPVVYPPQKERLTRTMQDNIYPYECRLAKISYMGKFMMDILIQPDDGASIRDRVNFGQFPIMLKSKLCHLRNASSKKLVSFKEEPSEMGGYFILNGLERVTRLLILPKRNYPTSMIRNSFRDRNDGYTDKAVVIRCVRADQSAVSMKLYYLSHGSARLGFWIQGREYMLPVGVMLKALVNASDHEIYDSLTGSYGEDSERAKGSVGTQLVGERAKIILDEVQNLSLFTHEQCLQHIGEHFKPIMNGLDNESFTTVAEAVLQEYIFVHLDNNHDKFNLLIFMLQKLFSLVDQTSMLDNPDSLQNQEILLPGHLITIYLKEKLQEFLLRVKRLLQDEIKNNKKFDLGDIEAVKKIISKNNPTRISSAIENMLKTGALQTQSGLDLQQRAGLTVLAERLNFLRYLSHFRAVHRGASFAGLRTTSVRKLLPESWGFLCPVHTPDGEPCGLLNHMASSCRITSFYDTKGNLKDFNKSRTEIVNVLKSVGMVNNVQIGPPKALTVMLDGRVVGSIIVDKIEEAVRYLRGLKLSAASLIPEDLEVGFVPLSMCGAYPGLYLFTSPSRFVRPVKNVFVPPGESNNIELIGPFEQVYMEISCPDGGEGLRKDMLPATHEEIHPTGMLSVVANLTPWSNHNQSPRNMYQCQMGKQTMGFPSQALHYRADQKLYHLQTPQTPIVRTKAYEKYNIDDFPLGTNAIVAVLAYSGYDMEDAMVLNKSSVERGMFHGHIYQTETIDLAEQKSFSHSTRREFRRSNLDKSSNDRIDSDGLPYVGQRLDPGAEYCSIYNESNNSFSRNTLKGSEAVVVDYVAVDVKSKQNLQKASIRFRRPRNPVIGDKFSSRHGQKGVCSQLWSDTDMPFSGTTGMRPDLIINPHAFPSRMTIGMLLESIAAKGGALNGEFKDATPFSNLAKKENKGQDSETALVDELGPLLASHGFNYHGTEVLYSGVYGTELKCEIFIGPVYYQRLRHMVLDKFQVRSTGAVDKVTRQPIKGRKRGGGVRFGEMERDSLLAHGAAYLLHDRLHTSSDYHVADICSLCGSILTTSVIQTQQLKIVGRKPIKKPTKATCVACQTSKGMEKVAMPYVFRYLAAELGAMNIKVTLRLKDGEVGA